MRWLVVRAILPDALVESSRTAALIEGEQRFRYGVDIQQGKRSRREARTALDGQEGMFGFVEVDDVGRAVELQPQQASFPFDEHDVPRSSVGGSRVDDGGQLVAAEQ